MAPNVLRLGLAYLLLLSSAGKIVAFTPFRASLLRWPIRSFRLRSAAGVAVIALELAAAILLFLSFPSPTIAGVVAAGFGAAFLLDGAHAARVDAEGACYCMGFGQPRSPLTVARSGFVLVAGVIVALAGDGPSASPRSHLLGLVVAVILAVAPLAVPATPRISRQIP